VARSGIAAAAVAVLVLAAFPVARSGTPDKQFQARYDAPTRQLSVSLPTFTGGTLSSAALAGRPTVLNSYASWCGVCNREMPDFQALHIALGQRVNVFGVNPQSNAGVSLGGQAQAWSFRLLRARRVVDARRRPLADVHRRRPGLPG